jgi:hypothetical protein
LLVYVGRGWSTWRILACLMAAAPDAGRLAAWLVSMQLDGPGWPAIELKEFAGAVGPRGLAEAARLTEERGVTAEPGSWTARGIKDLQERLAAMSGDIDVHVAVLAEDLRGAHRYGEIVAVLLPGQPVRPLGLVAAGPRVAVAGQFPADGRRGAAGPPRDLAHRAAGLTQPGDLIPLLPVQVAFVDAAISSSLREFMS